MTLGVEVTDYLIDIETFESCYQKYRGETADSLANKYIDRMNLVSPYPVELISWHRDDTHAVYMIKYKIIKP